MKCLGFIVLFPIASFASQPLRIFCQDYLDRDSKLSTLRSDVIQNYPTPEISLSDENNQPFKKILAYQPWKSDGLNMEVFVAAETQKGDTNFYQVHVYLPRRTGTSKIVSPSRALPENIKATLENRRSRASILAKVGEQILYPTLKQDEFALYNPTTQTKKVYKIDSGWANPRPSVSTSYVIFDKVSAKGGVSQMAYDLTTEKVVQRAENSQDTFSLEFNPINKAWTTSKSAVSYSSKPGSFEVARFENNELLKTTFTETGSNTVAIPLSPDLQKLLASSSTPTAMRSPIWAPGSNEIIFSLGLLNGLATYNFSQQHWNVVGIISRCFNPEWTTEEAP
jgi:hypothetical protein